MKLDAGIGREGLSVPKRQLDVVHLEIAPCDLDLDRRESALAGADDHGVVIEREAHATSAQQLPIGGPESKQNNIGTARPRSVPTKVGASGGDPTYSERCAG